MIPLVELDLYKKLQPLFKERMGPWQIGDWYYEINLNYQSGGRICVVGCNSHPNNINEIALRLPFPINPRNPERGCWGMLRGDVFLRRIDTGEYQLGIAGTRDYHIAPTPTLALLKALEAQEGLV